MIINPTPKMLKDGWHLSGNELYFTNKQGVNCTISHIEFDNDDPCYILVTDAVIRRDGRCYYGMVSHNHDLEKLAKTAEYVTARI